MRIWISFLLKSWRFYFLGIAFFSASQITFAGDEKLSPDLLCALDQLPDPLPVIVYF